MICLKTNGDHPVLVFIKNESGNYSSESRSEILFTVLIPPMTSLNHKSNKWEAEAYPFEF